MQKKLNIQDVISMQNKLFPTWIELSRSALNHNLDQLGSMTGPACKLGLVVKGNAYGHGLEPFAGVAAAHPKTALLFVGYLEEALLLRQRGVSKRICSLIPVDEFFLQEAIENEIELVCFDESYLAYFAKVAQKANKKALLHVKVDTGLARLGVMPNEVERFLTRFACYRSQVELRGVMTHLADVASDDISSAIAQCAIFEKICALFSSCSPLDMHAGASGAIGLSEADTLVRIGTSAYGYWKSAAQKARTLAVFPQLSWHPVMTWKTRIVHIKEVPTGTPIGYGHSFIAPQTMKLATVPVGYADGYPRALSNTGYVIVRGKLVPIVGRISMNLMTIDVTVFSDAAAVGEEVILMGPYEGISADDLAMKTGTINLDILSHVRTTIPRILV